MDRHYLVEWSTLHTDKKEAAKLCQILTNSPNSFTAGNSTKFQQNPLCIPPYLKHVVVSLEIKFSFHWWKNVENVFDKVPSHIWQFF